MAHTFGGPMYTRPHHWPLTRAIVWAAVTAAALLASSFALSSPAIADDAVPPDTTAEPGDGASITETPTETPTEPAPTESTPTESTPTESTPTEAAPSKKSEEDTAKSDGITAAVEPDFGFNKFRVGVQLEDGSVNPDGLTTLGSEITITETGPTIPDGEVVTTCTTTLEDPVEPTTTYCENLAPPPAPDELDDFYFSMGGGTSTITVEQTGVNDGLVIVDGTKIVVPCGTCEDDEGDVLLTDAIVSDSDDDDDDGDDDDGDESDDEESDDPEDGALPNVGAPDAALLGTGAILLAIGSRLIAGGRMRPRHRADGAII